jgi:pimeloyl-ACP methyl ester carboxylesterase
MQRRSVQFFSDQSRIDGDLYLPDGPDPGGRYPAIVSCSGYQGLKDIHPARFARAFVPDGYVCLAFDYRSFGNSEGERGRLVPQEQVEDVRSAISFLETVPEVDPGRVIVVGWALGGGAAVATAADDSRVRAVVALNAIGDGERSTRSMHDEQSWAELLEGIARDRRRRALGERSELVHPFKVVRLDEVTRGYVDEELYKVEGFGSSVTLESADFLLRFRPETVVDRIAPRPLLLIHGEENRLHLPEESRELYRRAGEPKELVLLEGSGHTEWMFDNHSTFQRVVNLVRDFLNESLGTQRRAPEEVG